MTNPNRVVKGMTISKWSTIENYDKKITNFLDVIKKSWIYKCDHKPFTIISLGEDSPQVQWIK